ncbi:MAG: hypothetical protein F6J92_32580 [Symploca sp. SIO1A3]|nr:hypothetical protein [Symploca sp. SIO1A3]
MHKFRQPLSWTAVFACCIFLLSCLWASPGLSFSSAQAANIERAGETEIILTTVECVRTSNHGDVFGKEDNVVIKYTIDGGLTKKFPPNGSQEMEEGEDWNPDLPLSFKDSVVVSLIDDDLAGSDSLGTHTYFPGDPQPDEVTVTGHKDAEYILFTEPAN